MRALMLLPGAGAGKCVGFAPIAYLKSYTRLVHNDHPHGSMCISLRKHHFCKMLLLKDMIICLVYLHAFLPLCLCSSSRLRLQRSRRNTALSNDTKPQPLFSTIVGSSHGSSNENPKIQTKVYIRPSRTHASNLTNRQILGERRILNCKSSTGTFHHSHCRHMKGVAYSIREYMTWCREPIDGPQPTFTLPSEARAMASSTGREDPSLHGEYGTCHNDEICVDSLYSIDYRLGFVLIANCVKKQLFRDAEIWNDEWDELDDEEGAEFGDESTHAILSDNRLAALSNQGAVEKGQSQHDWKGKQTDGNDSQNESRFDQLQPSLLSGKYASIIVTQGEEAIMPLEVLEIGLKSLGNESSQPSDAEGNTAGHQSGGKFNGDVSENGTGTQLSADPLIVEQKHSCNHCIDLKTSIPFAPDTEALEMEVKMIGVSSAAVVGILWVALLSG